jgi:hypothetical protein
MSCDHNRDLYKDGHCNVPTCHNYKDEYRTTADWPDKTRTKS